MYQPNDLYKHYKNRLIDSEYSSKVYDFTTKITLEHLNAAINLCKRWDAALDIGAGNGHYLAALAAKFRNAVGVEIDVIPSQKILSDRYSNINFFNGAIESYSTQQKFDFILLMDIFEHIDDIELFMKHVSDLQSKDGIVYVVTPNPLFCGPAAESDIYYTKSGYHGHRDHYTKNEIITICRKSGYEPELIIYEETKQREWYRRMVKGISRRDKRWSAYSIYKIARPFVLAFLSPILYIFEKLCYRIEKKHEADQLQTRSICLILKRL